MVTGRDGSYVLAIRFIDVRMLRPVSVVETLSSFPIDQTKSSNSRSRPPGGAGRAPEAACSNSGTGRVA